MRAIFLADISEDIFRSVYKENLVQSLIKICNIENKLYDSKTLKANHKIFRDVEYVFSTWGMPSLNENEISEIFPKLRAVFYAAGSVQEFARPFLAKGIKIFSAYAANAIPVAEYAFSQILLANAGYFQSSMLMKKGETDLAYKISREFPGNFDVNVGLIGMGQIARLTAKMLNNLDINVYVYDPYLNDEEAKALNVKKAELEFVFSNCQTISNHLPNNQETKAMLNYELFSKMQRNAVFINTGRGAQVVENDLIKALEEEPLRVAVLDVTHPEPPKKDSPFYSLDNVVLTPHIAGSLGNETSRMGQFMLDEFEAFINNKPTKYEVTKNMLNTMA